MWQDFLNIPILQALAVILLIGLAERLGIPTISFLKSFLKINGSNSKVEQKLDTMESNHLEHIEQKLEKLIEISQKVLFIVEDLKENK